MESAMPLVLTAQLCPMAVAATARTGLTPSAMSMGETMAMGMPNPARFSTSALSIHACTTINQPVSGTTRESALAMARMPPTSSTRKYIRMEGQSRIITLSVSSSPFTWLTQNTCQLSPNASTAMRMPASQPAKPAWWLPRLKNSIRARTSRIGMAASR